MTNTTIAAIKDNDNFLCGLELKKYNFNVYLTYRGGENVQYHAFLNNELLFTGEDYKPSPLIMQDSLEAVVSLLGFLCVQPGQTDPAYFAKYSDKQLDWAASHSAELLNIEISDFDYEDGDYHTDAVEYFEKAFIQ